MRRFSSSQARARMQCLALSVMLISVTAYSGDSPVKVSRSEGIQFSVDEDRYRLHLDLRAQLRASYPFEGFPGSRQDWEDEESRLEVNRARVKLGGHLRTRNLSYYLEQDVKGNNTLDARLMYKVRPALKFKLGQWKSRFSRERMISSGALQSLDRSLLNSIFTVDRQQGVGVYGDLGAVGEQYASYWASVLMGTGRGAWANDDNHPMYLLRLQYNPTGKVLDFVGSDLERRPTPVSSVALAVVTNRSAYTAFSTSGGGQLPGFAVGEPGQYRINQLLFETALQYRGFSWQQEAHYKAVRDKVAQRDTTLVGNYVQLGYFPQQRWRTLPRQLELFGRYAIYDPDTSRSGDNNQELALGANWFLRGHRNKLTLEFSYLDFDQQARGPGSGSNVRLQWDVSLR